MAKRPLKNDIPPRTAAVNSGIFLRQGRVNGANPYPSNRKAIPSGNGGSLTTNRQKPGGGAGSGGPTTSVKGY